MRAGSSEAPGIPGNAWEPLGVCDPYGPQGAYESLLRAPWAPRGIYVSVHGSMCLCVCACVFVFVCVCMGVGEGARIAQLQNSQLYFWAKKSYILIFCKKIYHQSRFLNDFS